MFLCYISVTSMNNTEVQKVLIKLPDCRKLSAHNQSKEILNINSRWIFSGRLWCVCVCVKGGMWLSSMKGTFS